MSSGRAINHRVHAASCGVAQQIGALSVLPSQHHAAKHDTVTAPNQNGGMLSYLHAFAKQLGLQMWEEIRPANISINGPRKRTKTRDRLG
jgi:hypothetical protein